MSQACEERHTGTSAPRQQPQGRGGVGRTAADTGCHGQHLFKRERAELQARHFLGEKPRCLEHQIIRRRAAGLRERPRRRQR
jgi:hypothetical protein